MILAVHLFSLLLAVHLFSLLLAVTGFFSPKFRVGEGTEVCQCVYIFFQRYGLSGIGSGEGKGGGA